MITASAFAFPSAAALAICADVQPNRSHGQVSPCPDCCLELANVFDEMTAAPKRGGGLPTDSARIVMAYLGCRRTLGLSPTWYCSSRCPDALRYDHAATLRYATLARQQLPRWIAAAMASVLLLHCTATTPEPAWPAPCS